MADLLALGTQSVNNILENSIARTTSSTGYTNNLAAVPFRTPTIPKSELRKLESFIALSDKFTMSFKDADGKTKPIDFELLPAIEPILSYSSPTSKFRGGPSVPEVRPGIPIRTVMRVKNQVVPGCYNLTQSLGVDSKSIILVGAIIIPKISATKHTYETAKFIDERIVQRGKLVTVTITTSRDLSKDPNNKNTISFTGSIIEFKYYTVRPSLTYYSFNIAYSSGSLYQKPKYKQLDVLVDRNKNVTKNKVTISKSGSSNTAASTIGSGNTAASTPGSNFIQGITQGIANAANAVNPLLPANASGPNTQPGPNYDNLYKKAVRYMEKTKIHKTSSQQDIDTKLENTQDSEFELKDSSNPTVYAKHPILKTSNQPVPDPNSSRPSRPYISIQYNSGRPIAFFNGPSAANHQTAHRKDIPLPDAPSTVTPETGGTTPENINITNAKKAKPVIEGFVNKLAQDTFYNTTPKETVKFYGDDNSVLTEFRRKYKNYESGDVKLKLLNAPDYNYYDPKDYSLSWYFYYEIHYNNTRLADIQMRVVFAYWYPEGSIEPSKPDPNRRVYLKYINDNVQPTKSIIECRVSSSKIGELYKLNDVKPKKSMRATTAPNYTADVENVHKETILAAEKIIKKFNIKSGDKLSSIKTRIVTGNDPSINTQYDPNGRDSDRRRFNFFNTGSVPPAVFTNHIGLNTSYTYEFIHNHTKKDDPTLPQHLRIQSYVVFLPKVDQLTTNREDSQAHTHAAVFTTLPPDMLGKPGIYKCTPVPLLSINANTPSIPNIPPTLNFNSKVEKLHEDAIEKANRLLKEAKISEGMIYEEAIKKMSEKASKHSFTVNTGQNGFSYFTYDKTIEDNDKSAYSFLYVGVTTAGADEQLRYVQKKGTILGTVTDKGGKRIAYKEKNLTIDSYNPNASNSAGYKIDVKIDVTLSRLLNEEYTYVDKLVKDKKLKRNDIKTLSQWNTLFRDSRKPLKVEFKKDSKDPFFLRYERKVSDNDDPNYYYTTVIRLVNVKMDAKNSILSIEIFSVYVRASDNKTIDIKSKTHNL